MYLPYAKIRRALADPGKVTPRQQIAPDAMETLVGWQTRAVAEVLTDWMADHDVTEQAVPSGVDENGDAWFEYPGGMVWSRTHGRHDSETVERFRAMAGALLAAIAYDERRHALEAVSHDG